MKKKILILSFILLFIVIGIIGYNVIKNKPKDNENLIDIGDNINTVTLKKGKANKDIVIDDITMSDIHIEENDEKKVLFLTLKSTTTNLDNISLTTFLLNEKVENSVNSKKIIFNTTPELDDNYRIVSIDITKIYNAPSRIKFIIEKDA